MDILPEIFHFHAYVGRLKTEIGSSSYRRGKGHDELVRQWPVPFYKRNSNILRNAVYDRCKHNPLVEHCSLSIAVNAMDVGVCGYFESRNEVCLLSQHVLLFLLSSFASYTEILSTTRRPSNGKIRRGHRQIKNVKKKVSLRTSGSGKGRKHSHWRVYNS